MRLVAVLFFWLFALPSQAAVSSGKEFLSEGYSSPRSLASAKASHRSKSKAPRKSTAKAAAHHQWGGSIVAEARRHIGTNPTRYSSLWCADFMNMVLERTGHRGTGSRYARDFDRYGTRISGPQVGAIAVMRRGKRGGHVGVVSGIDERGNPIIISGNHGRRVAESTYPRSRIYAYVMP